MSCWNFGSNNIYIGRTDCSESNAIRIGTADKQTRTFVAGIRGITTSVNDVVPVLIDDRGQLGTVNSSRRYKEDIEDMSSASSRLMALRPVTFRYRKPYANGEKPMQFGLIAEEVAQTFPELVVRNKEGQPETVKYQDLTPLLLNEVQKQAKTIAELQARAGHVSSGHVTTNKLGEATVTLPEDFASLNRDFRYQLMVVGPAAQAIVLEEVKGTQFKIKTDKPEVKVYWEVTGIRPDQFTIGNRIPKKEDK
jgi:Chaperone of endosialidase